MSDRNSGERILIAQQAPAFGPMSDRDFGALDGGSCTRLPQLANNTWLEPCALKFAGMDRETIGILQAETARLGIKDMASDRQGRVALQLAPGVLELMSPAARDRAIAYDIIQAPKAADKTEKAILRYGAQEDKHAYRDQLRRSEQELIKPVKDKAYSKEQQEAIFYNKVNNAHEIVLRESDFAYRTMGKAHRSSLGRLGVDDERIGLGTKDSHDRNEWLGRARYNFQGQKIQNDLDGVTKKDHYRLAYCFAQLSRVDRELGHTAKADGELAQALQQKITAKEAGYLKHVVADPKKFWEIANKKSW